MSESRPPLAASASFSGTSSTRPKRRISSTPEITFFAPASESFKPKPYAPQVAVVSALKPIPPRNQALTNMSAPIPVMDPSLSDPHSLFIHPPFTSFPDCELYPDGLTYSIMAVNPEWFLDAKDFISTLTSKTDAIPYPSQLEPPRGWCPAKKKDLKERGADGWPEGEEPRLRCTFCRRTYAGVNAKSMWRRHVFEKHKIAMANRREGPDRIRGRGSNKENRREPYTIPTLDQAAESLSNSRSRLRSLLPADGLSRRKGSRHDNVPSAPLVEQKEFQPSPAPIDNARPHPLSKSTLPASPPLTPARVPRSPEITADVFPEASPSPRPVIPPSPYDPTATPSFRHSSPRLPSDQPWRFPSPSHPLHSRAHELSLSMLARGTNSPATKVPSVLYASPASMERVNALNSSPMVPIFHQGQSSPSVLDSPDSLQKTPSLIRASPRTLFSRGKLPVPVADRMSRRRVEESPLSRSSRKSARGRRGVELGKAHWLSGSPARGLSDPIKLQGEDPFGGIYSWADLPTPGAEKTPSKGSTSSSMSSPEGESPVLRTSLLPPVGFNVGLGIGLMDPFTLSSSQSESSKEEESDRSEQSPGLQEPDESDDEDNLSARDGYMSEPDESLLQERRPLKRRKTIDSRC